jgi:glycosyltransferase involved in cell wall biosynthesis
VSRPLRILYFADIRFPLERANGIQTMETCWALAERGHTVNLVVRPDTHSPARDPFAFYGLEPRPRLIIERAPVSGPGLPPLARRVGYLAFAAGRALGAGRADVVMTRDLTTAAFLLRLPGRAPLVYESHGYAPEVAAALPEMLSTATPPSAGKLRRLAAREAHVWRAADGYVTITRGLAANLTKRLGPRPRLAVVHDGARLGGTPPANAPSAAPDAVTVVYAGHLYKWKGVDVLLEALAGTPGVRAVIVGGQERESDKPRLEAQAGELGLGDRVTFTGPVPRSGVPGWLARADILVLPNLTSPLSTHATSPLKLFEYMAAGRAIVASDLPSIREILTDDVTAVLVSPGDAAALAQGIRRLAGDAALRARLAAAAARAVAEYSWDERAARLETLFSDVVSSSSGR